MSGIGTGVSTALVCTAFGLNSRLKEQHSPRLWHTVRSVRIDVFAGWKGVSNRLRTKSCRQQRVRDWLGFFVIVTHSRNKHSNPCNPACRTVIGLRCKDGVVVVGAPLTLCSANDVETQHS